MDLDLWHEITLSAGTALGVLGFFRGLEQRKDTAFSDLTVRLCSHDSPVIQAGAAKQLPSFYRYHRYLVLRRPYGAQAIDLAVNALKIEKQPIFVRQTLIEALMKMMPTDPRQRMIRLHHAYLDDLIMMGFDFSNMELVKSVVTRSGLEGARFTGTNLWEVKMSHSNLRNADFTGAKLWGTDLSHTNLEDARLLTDQVNADTKLASSRLHGAILSSQVADLCRLQGCDLQNVRFA